MDKKKLMFGRIMCVIGMTIFLFSIIVRSVKHEYYFRDYGYGCMNLYDDKDETFEIKEATKVHIRFYSKIKGSMKVKLAKENGEVIFKNEDVNFNKKYTTTLEPGKYNYSIEYSELDGEFNISASKKTIFGISF